MERQNHKKLEILIVDPSAENVAALSAMLRRANFFTPSVSSVPDMGSALDYLRKNRADVLIIDIGDPSTGGRAALSNGVVTTLDMPVLAITDEDSEQLALEAVFGGAQDYLVRESLEPISLDRAVRYAFERYVLIKELRSLSMIDSLTGLYNRRAFYTLSQQQLKVSDRSGARLYLFFADLDNLKYVNDNIGHLAGDKMITDAGAILKGAFRESDLVARLGGDEFAVMALEVNDSGQDAMLERVRERIKEHNEHSSDPYEISMSVGVSLYDPSHPCTIEELLDRADRLMYQEKRTKKKRQAP